MTTYNIKSQLITNRDATPKVLTDAYVHGGKLASTEGFVQSFGSSDGAGSIYRMCQVPSNARVEGVKIQTSGLGSGCTLNVGVWYPSYIPTGAGQLSSNQSAVVNTTLFASAWGASSAVTPTDITNQSGNNTIQLQDTPLWNAAGFTSDPQIPLDICIEVQAAVAAQGYVGLKVTYQAD